MLQPGQVFAGRYRVIRLIAPGGMGAVFEAEHTGTERRVALKLLWPHVVALQSAREKFEFEAKVAARVQSEHIVHVFDAGYDEASRSPYLVMELLPGGTLAAFVQQHGRLTPELTVQLLQQVAKGLDAAHSLRDPKGARTPLIHRDLKPENLLLVAREAAPPLVKILDFGISKLLTESRKMSTEIRGTPMYMAYEQVATATLSAQTDIWALGLIAYYMLTGRSYWKSANDPEASVQALFMEIVMAPLVPASQRLAEQRVPFVLPEAFDGWLERCIDRVPECRFQSASAAIVALEAALRVELSAPTELARPAAATILSHSASFAALDVPSLRASTAASLPAIESSPSPARRGVLEELRARPLLTAFAGTCLLLGAGAVTLSLEREPGVAQPTSAALPLAPVEKPVEKSAPPAPSPQSPAAPSVPTQQDTTVSKLAAPPLPQEPPAPVPTTGKPGSPVQPQKPKRELGQKGQLAPVPLQQHSPAAPKRVEPGSSAKPRSESAPDAINAFDLRR